MKNKSVSLIITTYNWPKALKLVLNSVLTQSEMPDEVIVADDGSTEETHQIIQSFQPNFPVPLIHSWQEDKGFRLSRARNVAIAKSNKDYIVMIDGDMVLHKHFIRDHKSISKKGYFTQGRRVILLKQLTDELISQKKKRICLFSSQVKNKLNAMSCSFLSPLLTKMLSKKNHRSVRGCNMAYWRTDIININGYNEQFIDWGREDSEFVVRLINSGLKRQDLRFGGVAYHLYHQEKSRKNLNINDDILDYAINHKIKWCEEGLTLHAAKNGVLNE